MIIFASLVLLLAAFISMVASGVLHARFPPPAPQLQANSPASVYANPEFHISTSTVRSDHIDYRMTPEEREFNRVLTIRTTLSFLAMGFFASSIAIFVYWILDAAGIL